MAQEDSILVLDSAQAFDMLDVQLPQYYREGYFSNDSLLHPELQGESHGTAGNPIPYNVHSDNVITSILLVFFILAFIAYSKVRSFLIRQTKSFFYLPHEGTSEITETANETRFQVFLVFLVSWLFALLFYFYTISEIGQTFLLESPYYLIALFLPIMLGYFLLKAGLYTLVNNVFFDSKKNIQWIRSMLYLTTIEGLLLFPAVIAQTYFQSPIGNLEIYVALVLIFVKLLTIYKCYVIFFQRNIVFLQIILYFCALEIIPLLAIWGVLEMTANSLIINF